MFKLSYDAYSVHEIITQQGYIHEQHEVCTEDGYVLQMNRITNSCSMNVVYFQHGIVDSNTTWVVHGPGESIAFAAYDDGCDVFMGNFRGVYPRKVTPWRDQMQREGKADYWFYSIDHLAKYDIRAFIEAIFNIKVEDFKRCYPDQCRGLKN